MKKVFKVFAMDIKHLIKSPVAIIIMAGLCILPSLYAWINIKACWDPYANTGNLPIVVVNNDDGASFNGEFINVGEEVVNSLKENTSIGWVFKDEWQANDGLNRGEYYALIEIPRNFTEGLISLTTTTPRKPEIVYKANEKANAIATKIADVAKDSVIREVKANFVDTVNKTAIETISELADTLQINKPQILSLKETMSSASEDLDKISEYMTNTAAKSKELQDYLKKVQNDLPKITDAINNLQNAVEVSKNLIIYTNQTIDLISSNVNTDIMKVQTTNSEIQNLISKIKQDLKNGDKDAALEHVNQMGTLNANEIDLLDSDINLLQTVYNYNNDVSIMSEINILKNGQNLLVSRGEKINTLSKSIEQGDTDESIYKILDGLSEISNKITEVIVEASNLYYSTVVSVFDSIADNLVMKMDTVDNVLESTKVIVPELKALSNFMISTNSLSVKQINELNNKIISINEELKKLNEESEAFTSDTIDNMIEIMLNNPEEIASFISSPIQLKEEEVYDSGIFGVGLTPFYSVLAIWVGALLACCLLSVECEKDVKKKLKLNTFQEHFGKMILFLVISLIQSMIITLGDIYILGINPENIKVLLLFTVITSITFTSIIFTLVALLGNVGKAVAVIIMVFQIAGSGGIYPIQTNPEIFGVLEPLWPFTYAINGFREGISGAVKSHVNTYLMALLAFTFVFIMLALIKKPFHKLSSMMDHKFRESGM